MFQSFNLKPTLKCPNSTQKSERKYKLAAHSNLKEENALFSNPHPYIEIPQESRRKIKIHDFLHKTTSSQSLHHHHHYQLPSVARRMRTAKAHQYTRPRRITPAPPRMRRAKTNHPYRRLRPQCAHNTHKGRTRRSGPGR